MDSISEFISDQDARQRSRSRSISRTLVLWMTLVSIALLCAIVREYRALTTTVPAPVLQVADSVIYEACYQAWLDTVDGGRWATSPAYAPGSAD